MIPIYSAEKDIADQIAKASVVFHGQITNPMFETDPSYLEGVKSIANLYHQDDLVHFSAILCSIGTNKNYDHLLAEEVWPARHTPVNKQINYEHNERDIIGHMVASYGIDYSGKIIAETTTIDELPNEFHIVDAGVLYNSWASDDLRSRMSEILAMISRGELFVSMEALFKNFDYLLIDEKTQATELVRRDANTSFLTKYLRIYGGDGVYKDKKIARVLRHITFCGKGIVKRPANPSSVILKDDFKITCEVSKEESKDNGETETMSATVTDLKGVASDSIVPELVAKVEALTKALDQAQKEKAEANAKAEADAKAKAEKELVDLRDQVKAKDAEVKSANDKAEAALEAIKASETKIVELENTNKTLSDEMNKIKAAQKTADRVAKLVTAGKSQDDAEKMVAKFDTLDDAAFDEIVSVVSAAYQDMKKEKDDDEDDASKANVEDLETAKTEATLTGNSDSGSEPEYKGLASLFAGELRSTASVKAEDLNKLLFE